MSHVLEEVPVERAQVLDPRRPATLRERLAAVPIFAWVVGIVALSAGFRFLLALWVPAPWLFIDELIYSELSKSVAATGHFAIRDVPGLQFEPLYPVLIAPAYAAFDNLPHAYLVVKLINSVVMSCAAVPAYFLGRRLLSQRGALAVAALTLAVPSMVYTGLVLTENLFYPVFLAAALAIVRMLERPTAGRQMAALGVIGIALLTRFEALALVPALATAIVAFAAGEGTGFFRRLRAFMPTMLTLAGVGVAVVAWEGVHGRGVTSAFRSASGVWQQHYSAVAVARWFAYHLAELDLYVGIIPFAAFLLVATFAFSRADRVVRLFAVVSASLVFWVLLTAALFASGLTRYEPRTGSHVFDRYTFYVAPLMLIPLLAWATRRVTASDRRLAVIAAVAGLLPLVMPYRRLIDAHAVAHTVGFLPWAVNSHGVVVARPQTFALAAIVALSLGALFFLLRRPRVQYLAPLLIGLYLVSSSVVAARWYHAEGSAAELRGPNKAWIDAALPPGATTVAIWSGHVGPHLIWENEFFNRSVGRVYYLKTPTRVGVFEQKLAVRPRSAVLVDQAGHPLRARYALVDPWVILRGRVVARDRASGMRLYRLSGGIGRTAAQ
jgi:hypothetical protein